MPRPRSLSALLFLLALTVCSPAPTSAGRTATERPTRSVRVATAEVIALPKTILAYGSLAADAEVRLGFRNAGRLQHLDVDLGSSVERGATIAALDTTIFELELREAETAVRQARVRLGLSADGDDDVVDPQATAIVRQARAVLTEATVARSRTEELVQKNLAAPAALDVAVAAHGVAESRLQQALEDVQDRLAELANRRASLALAQQRLREATLTAPFDGVAAARHADAQEFVAAGAPVVTILRTDPLRLRLMVPERDAGAISIGQPVQFTVDGVDGEHTGRIARLSPRIELDNRTLLVEAEVANAERRLRPGLFARATIAASAPIDRVTVPRAAVVSFAGVDKVFRIDNGAAVEQQVRIGRQLDDRVEIESGLAAGAVVVVEPRDLVDGQRVQVEHP